VRHLLTDADSAVREAQRAARGEVGRLTVGFMGPAMWPLLPQILRDYEERYPGVEVVLREMMPDLQEAAFRAGRLDVGFTRSLGGAVDELLLEEELIYTDRIVAAVPEGHPLARRRQLNFQHLAKEKLALLHRPGAPAMYDQILGACHEAGIAPRVAYEPDHMTTVLTWVSAGSAIGLVPGCTSHYDVPQAVFRELRPSAGPLPLMMVHRRGDDSPTVAAWIERIRAQRELLAKGIGRCCDKAARAEREKGSARKT
jgi:DNA-binding transcriptional LysR family regulator